MLLASMMAFMDSRCIGYISIMVFRRPDADLSLGLFLHWPRGAIHSLSDRACTVGRAAKISRSEFKICVMRRHILGFISYWDTLWSFLDITKDFLGF